MGPEFEKSIRCPVSHLVEREELGIRFCLVKRGRIHYGKNNMRYEGRRSSVRTSKVETNGGL